MENVSQQLSKCNKNTQKKARNFEVDFYRLLFSIIIVIHHTKFMIGDENAILASGALAVEFFFLCSGYFMAATISRIDKKASQRNLVIETISFLRNKVKSLYSYLVVSCVIGMIFVCIVKVRTILQFLKLLAGTIIRDFCLLRMLGIISTSGDVNSVDWYISSMLLSMLFLYPLYRHFGNRKLFRICAFAVACALIALLCRETGTLRDPGGKVLFTYRGNIRAFGEIILGASIFLPVQKIKGTLSTPFRCAVITVLKYGALFFSLFYMVHSVNNMDVLILIAMIIFLVAILSEQSIETELLHRCLGGGVYRNTLARLAFVFTYPIHIIASTWI